jgi:hypothetical protein
MGIRKPNESRNTTQKVSLLASESTSYLLLGTWYNEVLLLDTNYLILFSMLNAERRLENEEVEIREPYESRNTTQ